MVETEGLSDLLGGDIEAQVTLVVKKLDGSTARVQTKHTLSAGQIEWIKAGSALNYIRERVVSAS